MAWWPAALPGPRRKDIIGLAALERGTDEIDIERTGTLFIDELVHPGVNFGTGGSTQFDARVASGAAAGVSGLVNVVLDSPTNAPVGSFAIGSTGGWSTWKTIPANITKVTGTHTVYLEFSSGAGGNPPFVSLHYFSFPAM